MFRIRQKPKQPKRAQMRLEIFIDIESQPISKWEVLIVKGLAKRYYGEQWDMENVTLDDIYVRADRDGYLEVTALVYHTDEMYNKEQEKHRTAIRKWEEWMRVNTTKIATELKRREEQKTEDHKKKVDILKNKIKDDQAKLKRLTT